MADYRITRGRGAAEAAGERISIVEALIHRGEEIARRYRIVSSNLPYRSLGQQLLDEDVSALVAQLAAATWKRMRDEVPSYAFAEKIGRRYREAGVPVGSLLLHWQILRRAIHLVLAERRIRTGEGDQDMLRQATLMNYTMDWAIEASLVTYVIAQPFGGSPANTVD